MKIRNVGLFLAQTTLTTILISLVTGVAVSEVWYLAKAQENTWLGFTAGKFMVLIISLPRYLSGTSQIPDIQMLPEHPFNMAVFILGTLILIKLFAETVGYYKSFHHPAFLKPTLIFIFFIFIVGSLMNAYEFGSDSQFLIQPFLYNP